MIYRTLAIIGSKGMVGSDLVNLKPLNPRNLKPYGLHKFLNECILNKLYPLKKSSEYLREFIKNYSMS